MYIYIYIYIYTYIKMATAQGHFGSNLNHYIDNPLFGGGRNELAPADSFYYQPISGAS